MYAKIYEQIFDSSLAEHWQTRHVFEDLIKLAKRDGIVDMTHEAIARRTNVPLEIVRTAIAELEQPDPRSRSQDDDGRRIIRLDDHRDWGWKIVNHNYYRNLKTEEEKQRKNAERQREYRNAKRQHEKSVTPVTERDRALSPEYVSESAFRLGGGVGEGKPTEPPSSSVPDPDNETVVELSLEAHKAFSGDKPPPAYPSQLVLGNVHELLRMGRPPDSLRAIFRWRSTTDNKHKPKSANALTDPERFEQWQTMMGEDGCDDHGKNREF